MPNVLCRALGVVALVFLAAGCGEKPDGRVVIRGKLVEGAKPFVLDTSKLKLPGGATGVPPGSRPLTLTFIAVEGSDQQFAVVNLETGTFEVLGDGKGIKPGKYKIALTAAVGGPDYFGGKFAADKTQIVREVKAGEEIVIDVTKPQG